MHLIHIDGSSGEGGGQIIRTALALSTLTGKPFLAENIRQGRPQPGLKAQHVACTKILQELCDAQVKGAEQGSLDLLYIPGKVEPKNIHLDVGTAGSLSLLLQAVLLPCLFAEKPTRLVLVGGTDTAWSMPWDHYTTVFLPLLGNIGKIDVELLQRGYYPKGGGKIDIKIRPSGSREKFDLVERGELLKIGGISHASSMLREAEVVERQASAAKKFLLAKGYKAGISTSYSEASCIGSGIVLWAAFEHGMLGADALGERNKRSEAVGKEAAAKLVEEIESGGCVDQHVADNIIPFLAVCSGSMRVSKVTSHLRSAMETCRAFLPERKIEERADLITVT